MKFLTKAIYDAYYGNFEDDRQIAAASEAYRQRLAELAALLPERVRSLTELCGVEDGLVAEAHHLRSLERLILVLRCGDLMMGYYDLALTYEGAEISPRDDWTLAQIARSTKDDRRHRSDVFAHELDIMADGRIEHRLMFHPGCWFAIRCRELRWEKLDRPNRELPRFPDRYPSGPAIGPPRRRPKRLRSTTNGSCQTPRSRAARRRNRP